jgi:hypothetical protein
MTPVLPLVVSLARDREDALDMCAMAEQVPWDVEQSEASASLRMGLKIGLDKDLDGFVAGVNFDADRGIAEIDFVPATIVSTNNRVRHFGPAPLDTAPAAGGR